MRRFQIHLSTSVVLMFVAGGLIWANVKQETETFSIQVMSPTAEWISNVRKYGWPRSAVETFSTHPNYLSPFGSGLPHRSVRWDGIAIDVGIALAILAGVWFGCETVIRWRGKKDA